MHTVSCSMHHAELLSAVNHFAPVGLRNIVMSMYICLSVHLHNSKTTQPIFTKFLCMSFTDMTEHSSNGVVISSVLPILQMTPLSCIKHDVTFMRTSRCDSRPTSRARDTWRPTSLQAVLLSTQPGTHDVSQERACQSTWGNLSTLGKQLAV